ncbi:MAG: tetratricopeptide repeat protein [Candidatus Wallbacteria bacterium]|nr:tetratricopeptide repeat protein [Candidatus Wallbacteria bacterium]
MKARAMAAVLLLGVYALRVDAAGRPSIFDPSNPPAAVRSAFERFDLDEDGKISRAEWEPLVREKADEPIDFDGDGAIGLAEFARSFEVVNSRVPPNQGILAKRFLSEGKALAEAGDLAGAEARYRKAIELYPEWAGVWTSLGEVLGQQGRREEARRALSRATELAPNSQMAWLRLATVEHALGTGAASERALERGLALLDLRLAVHGRGNRREAELGHAEGEVMRLTQYFTHEASAPAKSLELLARCEKFLGGRPRLAARRAWTMAVGGTGEPLVELDREERQSGVSYWSLDARGRITRRQGRAAEASEWFAKALARSGEGAPSERRMTMLDQVEALTSAGRTAAASQALALVVARSRTARERLDVARMLLRCGRRAEAAWQLQDLERMPGGKGLASPYERAQAAGDVAGLERMLREDARAGAVRYLDLAALMDETGSPPGAVLGLLDRALVRHPGEASIWTEKVRRLEESGQDAKAAGAARQALERLGATAARGTLGTLRLALARTLARAGRRAEALEHVREARRLNAGVEQTAALEVGLLLDLGRDADGSAALGRLEAERLSAAAVLEVGRALLARNRMREAAVWLERAIGGGQGAAANRLLLAQARLESGDRPGAVEALQGVEVDALGGDAAAQFLMAGVLSSLGKKQRAAAHQRRGVEAKPGDARAVEQLALMLEEIGDGAGGVRALDRALAGGEIPEARRAGLRELRARLAEESVPVTSATTRPTR